MGRSKGGAGIEGTKFLLIQVAVPAFGAWLYWKISQRMCHPLSRPLLLWFISYEGADGSPDRAV